MSHFRTWRSGPRCCCAGAHLALLLVAASTVGCSSLSFDWDMDKNIPWGAGEGGVYGKPMKIIAMWQDTVLHQGGRPPVRGFGGRLMFYGSDDEKPVKVSGTLEVYAFKENDRLATNTKPDRKYVISTEDFEKHYSKNALGHSYSVWVPWDQVGGEQTELSLIVRFTPSDGGASITSEQTRHVLPGRKLLVPPKPPGAEAFTPLTENRPVARQAAYIRGQAPATGESAVAQAAYWEQVKERPSEREQMSTTTIALPTTLMRQTMNGGAFQPRQGGPQDNAPATSGGQSFGGQSLNPAAPQAGPNASVPPQTASSAQQSDYQLSKHRAQGGPVQRPDRDRGPWRLRRSRSQFGQSPALGQYQINASISPGSETTGSR